jgi:hypothetical protein
MKPLKYILFLLMIFSFYIPIKAQTDDDEKFENFKSRRIAFISEQVKLTPKEAEVFWPVYNEFDAKRQTINKERLKTAKYYLINKESLSENEASDLADKIIALQKKEAQLSEEYNSKFKAVLPSSKVLKLYQAELQFKRQLLKQLKDSNPKTSGRQNKFNKD